MLSRVGLTRSITASRTMNSRFVFVISLGVGSVVMFTLMVWYGIMLGVLEEDTALNAVKIGT